MTHELQSLADECVRLLVEAGVLDDVECDPSMHRQGEYAHGACAYCGQDVSGDTGKVEHPLRPLLVAQDAYGVESGLMERCAWHLSIDNDPCELCGGVEQGYVARSIDGWPEAAVVGWVKAMTASAGIYLESDPVRKEAVVGTLRGRSFKEMDPQFCTGDTEAEAALRALLAAIQAQVQDAV